jgi:RNA polymerase sigma-70 factor (ECF subfamily)
VFHDYAKRIYRLARRMLGNDTDAEDITQEVLVQVVRKLETFRREAEFTTWLHRVVVNAALAYRRKCARRAERQLPDFLEQALPGTAGPRLPRAGSAGPDRPVLDREARRLIEGAVHGLPSRYREVFILAGVEGLSNADIAVTLGIGLAAVKSRLHRARLMLREALARHFGGPGAC